MPTYAIGICLLGFPEVPNLNLWFIVPKNVSKPLLSTSLANHRHSANLILTVTAMTASDGDAVLLRSKLPGADPGEGHWGHVPPAKPKKYIFLFYPLRGLRRGGPLTEEALSEGDFSEEALSEEAFSEEALLEEALSQRRPSQRRPSQRRPSQRRPQKRSSQRRPSQERPFQTKPFQRGRPSQKEALSQRRISQRRPFNGRGGPLMGGVGALRGCPPEEARQRRP